MALDHALLVPLSEQAGSGYELTRRFDRSIGFFWGATHQQIYRVLRRVEDRGWVEATVVPQDGRPDKKDYRVSAAGARELARWIAAPTEPGRLRDELAVKIRAAAHGDADALRAEVAQHRDRHAERLAHYRAMEHKGQGRSWGCVGVAT